MKKSLVVGVLVAAGIVAGRCYAADLPFNVQVLAQIDETISFCSDLKPDHAAEFKKASVALFKNLSATDLEEARKSDSYKEARESVKESLTKLENKDVETICASAGPTASK